MSGKRDMRRNVGFFAISSTDFNLIALHSKYIEPASNHYLNVIDYIHFDPVIMITFRLHLNYFSSFCLN
jgi:hypothetical protein